MPRKRTAPKLKGKKAKSSNRKSSRNDNRQVANEFTIRQKPASQTKSALRKSRKQLEAEAEAEVDAFIKQIKAQMVDEEVSVTTNVKSHRAPRKKAEKKPRFRLAKKSIPKPPESSSDSESSLDDDETIADLGRRLNRLAAQKAEQKIDDGILDSDEELPPMRPIKSAMKVNKKRAESRAKRFGIKNFTENPDAGDKDEVEDTVKTNAEGKKIVERKVISVARKPVPTMNMSRASEEEKEEPKKKPILIRPRKKINIKAEKPKSKVIITKPLKGTKAFKPLNERVWSAKSTGAALQLLMDETKLSDAQIMKLLADITFKSNKKRKYSNAALAREWNKRHKGDKSKKIKVKDMDKLIGSAELPADFQW